MIKPIMIILSIAIQFVSISNSYKLIDNHRLFRPQIITPNRSHQNVIISNSRSFKLHSQNDDSIKDIKPSESSFSLLKKVLFYINLFLLFCFFTHLQVQSRISFFLNNFNLFIIPILAYIKWSTIQKRWLTGLSLGLIATFWIFSGNGIFTLGFLLTTIISQLEYYNMVQNTGVEPAKKIGKALYIYRVYLITYDKLPSYLPL